MAEQTLEVDFEEVVNLLGEYWASPSRTEEEIFASMGDLEETYFQVLLELGFLQMYRVAYSTFYGLNGTNAQFEAQSIHFSGNDDEFVDYIVNEFRSFVDQILNMTTKNRPAFQAQAINTDTDAIAQIEAVDNIVTYFFEQFYGERKEREVVKSEQLYGKGYTYIDWDDQAGNDVEIEVPVDDPRAQELGIPPIKKKVKSGSFIFKRKYLWHVISDPLRSEIDGHDWRIVLDVKNKYDLIAKYPAYAKNIYDQVGKGLCRYASMFPGPALLAENNEDDIIVRILLHGKCPVLPEGRKCVFVGEKMVEDGPLPIDEIPVVDYVTCELDGTGIGISDLWNLIPCQQMNNQLLSDIATNVEAFGRPPIVTPEGADLDIDAMANGQKVMSVPSMDQMPQVMEFPQMSDMPIKLVDMNRKFEQVLSGLNAVSRGENDASVQSGTHAALYHAMAAENQSPRQAGLDHHRERTMNISLQFMKKFAKYPQMVAVAGRDERPYMQPFSADDVSGVHKVVVKTAPPLLRTQAGKTQVAELLKDWPGTPIKDPAEIVTLLSTGQLKPMYNPTRIMSMQAKRENEALAAGPPVQEVPTGQMGPDGQPIMKKTVPSVPVLMLDNISDHVFTHLEIVYGPGPLESPAKQAALAHILEHFEVARTADPYISQILSNPPPPQAPAPPGAPPDQQGRGPSQKDSEQAKTVMTNPADTQPINDTGQNDKTAGILGKIPAPAKPPAPRSAA